MPKITATTGASVIRSGSTRLDFGIIKPDGTFVAREMHRHFLGNVTDAVRQTVPASTMGANSGVLGSWVTREISVPDKQVMVLSYSVKSSAMPIKKSITLALEFDDTYPLLELSFRVVTDRNSTLYQLPIMGRMRLLDTEAINKEKEKIKYSMGVATKLDEAIDCLTNLSEEAVLNHWANLSSHKNSDTDGQTFLTVVGNRLDEYPITVKYLLPGQASAVKKATGKTVKTANGRKVTIASRRRRIKLS